MAVLVYELICQCVESIAAQYEEYGKGKEWNVVKIWNKIYKQNANNKWIGRVARTRQDYRCELCPANMFVSFFDPKSENFRNQCFILHQRVHSWQRAQVLNHQAGLTMEVDSESTTTASTAKRDVRYDVEFTRAIKENHGHPIVDVAWCPFKGGEAYYATVGANQVWLDVNPCSLSWDSVTDIESTNPLQ